MLRVKWKSTYKKYFFNSFHSLTDYGACANIYPYLDFENPLTKNAEDRQYNGTFLEDVKYGVRNGLKNGLEIMADTEIFDYAYFFRHSSGFMVSLADNRDKAIINQKGFYIAPGTTNLVSMTAEIMNTTEDAISRFSPELRTCHAQGEVDFKYLQRADGYRYSIDNCFYEAVLGKIIDNCQCVPFFVTVDIGITLPKCRYQWLSSYIFQFTKLFFSSNKRDIFFGCHCFDQKTRRFF